MFFLLYLNKAISSDPLDTRLTLLAPISQNGQTMVGLFLSNRNPFLRSPIFLSNPRSLRPPTFLTPLICDIILYSTKKNICVQN